MSIPSELVTPAPPDIDIAALGRSLWRAKFWVLALSLGAGIATFVALSMVRPLYTSEARILIENDVSPYTRAASDQGRDQQQQTLDEQAIQSQVQVLTSRDLALEVTRTLDLVHNPEFAKDAGGSWFKRLLDRLHLGHDSEKSEEEKAADAFIEHLEVYALNKSSVIAIDFTSGDPDLAAKAANALADAYINWQRSAKIEQTKDATTWLSDQIDELRKKVSEGEAAVEQYRASSGLYEGSNNVSLNAQQLSELNSQLIMASAQRSEAEARAKLIKDQLDSNGDVDTTPEVLKSELIGRLIEQRVLVQRQLAELSATLLPSHPRVKQLNSELDDIRGQIRDEAAKIVKSLDNEAQVAAAREASLRNSLNEAKSQSTDQSEAAVKLRAMEREVKANRDLLESYLARYRDASSRHEMGAVPANATIVSQAHAASTPSYPKRLPMAALVTAATALLSLAYLIARDLIGAAPMPVANASGGYARSRLRESVYPPAGTAPEPEPELPFARASSGSVEPRRPSASARDGLRTNWAIPDDLNQREMSSPRPERQTDRNLLERLRQAAPQAPASKAQSTADAPAPSAASQRSPRSFASFDELFARISKDKSGKHTLLVTPGGPKSESGSEAIALARALARSYERVALIDLGSSKNGVSSLLRLPRAPGFADLVAGRASFDEVIRIDAETPLQVITDGEAVIRADGASQERCERILAAFAEAYDRIVLHGDRGALSRFGEGLKQRLSLAVAVIPTGAPEGEVMPPKDLGCELLIYTPEGAKAHARAGLLGRVASL